MREKWTSKGLTRKASDHNHRHSAALCWLSGRLAAIWVCGCNRWRSRPAGDHTCLKENWSGSLDSAEDILLLTRWFMCSKMTDCASHSSYSGARGLKERESEKKMYFGSRILIHVYNIHPPCGVSAVSFSVLPFLFCIYRSAVRKSL